MLFTVHMIFFDRGFSNILHTANVNAQCSFVKLGTAVVEKAVLATIATQYTPSSFCSKSKRKQAAIWSLFFHFVISATAALLFKGGASYTRKSSKWNFSRFVATHHGG